VLHHGSNHRGFGEPLIAANRIGAEGDANTSFAGPAMAGLCVQPRRRGRGALRRGVSPIRLTRADRQARPTHARRGVRTHQEKNRHHRRAAGSPTPTGQDPSEPAQSRLILWTRELTGNPRAKHSGEGQPNAKRCWIACRWAQEETTGCAPMFHEGALAIDLRRVKGCTVVTRRSFDPEVTSNLSTVTRIRPMRGAVMSTGHGPADDVRRATAVVAGVATASGPGCAPRRHENHGRIR